MPRGFQKLMQAAWHKVQVAKSSESKPRNGSRKKCTFIVTRWKHVGMTGPALKCEDQLTSLPPPTPSLVSESAPMLLPMVTDTRLLLEASEGENKKLLKGIMSGGNLEQAEINPPCSSRLFSHWLINDQCATSGTPCHSAYLSPLFGKPLFGAVQQESEICPAVLNAARYKLGMKGSRCLAKSSGSSEEQEGICPSQSPRGGGCPLTAIWHPLVAAEVKR